MNKYIVGLIGVSLTLIGSIVPALAVEDGRGTNVMRNIKVQSGGVIELGNVAITNWNDVASGDINAASNALNTAITTEVARAILAEGVIQTNLDDVIARTNLSSYNNDVGYLTNAPAQDMNHASMTNLEYANAGHTGFQPAGSYLTNETDPVWSGASNSVVYTNDIRLTDARTPLAHNQDWSTVTGTPVSVQGYGITNDIIYEGDARLTDARTPTAHNQAWSTITSTPTSIAGYGITDTIVQVESDPIWAASSNSVAYTGDLARVEGNLNTASNALNTAITVEVARAISAEGIIAVALSNEVARATNAEAGIIINLGTASNALNVAITTEVARATLAEGLIQTNLNNTSNTLHSVDTNLQAQIDARVKINGDSLMGGNLQMNGHQITGVTAGSADTDAVNKKQLDDGIAGLSWKQSVKTITNEVPASVIVGDRYLVGTAPLGDFLMYTNQIAQCTNIIGATNWAFSAPTNGWAIFTEDQKYGYVYNSESVSWANFAGATVYSWGAGLTANGNIISTVVDTITVVVSNNAIQANIGYFNNNYVNEGQSDAISEAMITNGAVTVNKLGDYAVSNLKLATNAVTTTRIEDGAVTGAKIDTNALVTIGGLTVTGSTTLVGTFITTPSTVQVLGESSNVVANATLVKIVSTNADVTLTSNPQIAVGVDGQIVTVRGTDDAKRVEFVDGNGVQLDSGVSFILGLGDVIQFQYDTATSVWVENFRKDN